MQLLFGQAQDFVVNRSQLGRHRNRLIGGQRHRVKLACDGFDACRLGQAGGDGTVIDVDRTGAVEDAQCMRDFAVDVINVVRKAQEENKAKLRAAELKFSASGAAT
jgi:hypothetical protein